LAAVSEALESSAELDALRHRIAAAEAAVRPAGSLPDPVATVGLSNVPVGGLELDRTPMSGIDLGVSQRLPAKRKRRLSADLQQIDAEALRARYDDRRSDLIRRVKRAYIDVQRLDGEVAVARDSKELAESILATAEAKYATGKGLQQDVFRAQVRLSRTVEALLTAVERRKEAVARLNELLYRSPGNAVPELPPLVQTTVVVQGSGESVVECNQQLREARLRVEQAAARESLAAAGSRPDITLGLRYRIRRDTPMDPVGGDDFWSATVGVTLPWVYRKDTIDQEVMAAGALRKAAEADLSALVNELEARAEELVVRVGRLRDQIALAETGLLPQAEGALASSRAAYATGRVEFLTVIDNQINLYNLHLERIRLLAEHEQSLAELEYLTGGSAAGRPAAEEVGDDGA
jgi:outer membrane protein TolC